MNTTIYFFMRCILGKNCSTNKCSDKYRKCGLPHVCYLLFLTIVRKQLPLRQLSNGLNANKMFSG